MKVIRVADIPVMVGSAVLRAIPPRPMWVKIFDVNAEEGAGKVSLTEEITEAVRFDDAHEAIDLWRAQSTVRPLRDDGKPNRPLTSLTVVIEDAP